MIDARPHEAGLRAGIYAIASLDGTPLQHQDRFLLGLGDSPGAHSAQGACVQAIDLTPGSPAVSIFKNATTLIAFAGFLDEDAELRKRFALESATTAELAWTVVEHLGAAAPAALLGEWSLLHWDQDKRELALLTSATLRDPLYWATDGRFVAVAPDMLALCRLSWVGRTLDPHSFALHLSRSGLRRVLGAQTVWKGVSKVLPGVCERFLPGKRQTTNPAAEPPPQLWQGSFEEAVEASTLMLRHIMRQQLQRYGRLACLLSGGLDSTLLTVLAAEAQEQGTGLFCISSVAPEASGLPDERAFSAAVAEQAGLDIHFLCPPAAPGVYRPDPLYWARIQMPVAGPRHYLYTAFWAEARLRGALALIDGAGGEYSVTHKVDQASAPSWSRRLRAAAGRWSQRRRLSQDWPASAFHFYLSDDVLRSLPPGWNEIWKESSLRPANLLPGSPLGFLPGLGKSAALDTSIPTGLRHMLPFRDRRILRLLASFPIEFFAHQGVTRAVGRAMLRGKAPESVRLRPPGLPISPDYASRMQSQAAAARARLPVFHAAGLDQYLNLSKLAEALLHVERGNTSLGAKFAAASTACAAEFLLWTATQP